MSVKPMLFNTEMVRAILDGKKTATRRVVKEPYYIDDAEVSRVSGLAMHRGTNITHGMPYPDSLYCVNDILYVRETWAEESNIFNNNHKFYIYKANYSHATGHWYPSIHMPRKAARIWLRVTDVRVERLQEITVTGLQEEGIVPKGYLSQYTVMTERDKWFGKWKELWDSTIKPTDRDRYGWKANPWVWVIRFERCEKPEGWENN